MEYIYYTPLFLSKEVDISMPMPTNNRLTTLIPFDLIIDTDYGLIQLIKDEYNDKSVFTDLVEARYEQLIWCLYNRNNSNPLTQFMWKEDDKESIDSLYEDFINTKYIDILKRSRPTGFYEAVKLFNKSDGAITPIIMCKNKMEESYINKLSKVDEIIPSLSVIVGNYNDIDVSTYDPIYFKYYKDTLKCLDKLKGKNIYIANYKFNFISNEKGEKVLLPDISLLLLDQNIAKNIDIYSFNEEDIPL